MYAFSLNSSKNTANHTNYLKMLQHWLVLIELIKSNFHGRRFSNHISIITKIKKIDSKWTVIDFIINFCAFWWKKNGAWCLVGQIGLHVFLFEIRRPFGDAWSDQVQLALSFWWHQMELPKSTTKHLSEQINNQTMKLNIFALNALEMGKSKCCHYLQSHPKQSELAFLYIFLC